MKKSYSLKLISFFMLAAAMVRFIMGIMMFNYYSKMAILAPEAEQLIKYSVAAFILILVVVLFLVICGFVGAICWDDPDVSLKCVFLGIGTIIGGLVANWMQYKAGYLISWPVWVSGTAVPALYVIIALIFYISYRTAKRRKAKEN